MVPIISMNNFKYYSVSDTSYLFSGYSMGLNFEAFGIQSNLELLDES
jgi:hypothetical protein